MCSCQSLNEVLAYSEGTLEPLLAHSTIGAAKRSLFKLKIAMLLIITLKLGYLIDEDSDFTDLLEFLKYKLIH